MKSDPKVDSLIERLARFTESSYAQIGLAVLLVLTGYTLLFSYFLTPTRARISISAKTNSSAWSKSA